MQFATYATHLIEGHIRHYLRDKAMLIRQPAWVQEMTSKISKTADTLAQELERTALELPRTIDVPADRRASLDANSQQLVRDAQDLGEAAKKADEKKVNATILQVNRRWRELRTK